MRLLWPCCAELEELAVVWIQPFEKFSLDHGQMSLNQVKRGFNRMEEYVFVQMVPLRFLNHSIAV